VHATIARSSIVSPTAGERTTSDVRL
jgi:hypothetical protein